MKLIDSLDEFVEKASKANEKNALDLSSDQDLSIAIMNLISIEEHLFFTGAKTNDTSFYDMIIGIREDRKELLKKIIKQYKGEVWCISKHLLAGCMRLMEVGTKTLSGGDKNEAYEFFDKAYSLYCLFWALNMDNFDTESTKKLVEQVDKTTLDRIKADKDETTARKKKDSNLMSKLKSFVSKAIDCCRE